MNTLSRFLLLLCVCSPVLVAAQQSSTAPAPAYAQPQPAASVPSADVDVLLSRGKLDEAAGRCEELLKSNPDDLHARAGLIRARLLQERVGEAYEMAKAAVAATHTNAQVLVAMGDVQFRRGEIADSERSYLQALRLDPKEVRARLGLVNIYRAYSLYGKAYDRLKTAHEIDPNDEEVRREWMSTLPRKERLAALKEYLALSHPIPAEELTGLKEYAGYLEATANQPAHSCRLTNKVESTTTPIDLLLWDAEHIRGYGLTVKLNDRASKLMLDTGASGIVINRKLAERAGLERISHVTFGGIGNRGPQSGYAALAKSIRVGGLVFEDCVVEVSDRRSVADEEGLIGSDVFRHYLIDIDGRGGKLGLSPLPKRPDADEETTSSLNTDDDGLGIGDESAPQAKAGEKPAAPRMPKDRYVAPEMAQWTKVFRIGHELLIPTQVNDSLPMLFLIDTGATSSMLSVGAARQVTKVDRADLTTVSGVSGKVDKVYSARKAKLQFSHFAQQNQDVITFDLSSISRNAGVEVSGLLGMTVLNLLELKIDYRDGLVDFVYDPKRFPGWDPR